jgi:hypothetical protein
MPALITLLGTGRATREFLHVDDCAEESCWPLRSTTHRMRSISARLRDFDQDLAEKIRSLTALVEASSGTNRSLTVSRGGASTLATDASSAFERGFRLMRGCARRLSGIEEPQKP